MAGQLRELPTSVKLLRREVFKEVAKVAFEKTIDTGAITIKSIANVYNSFSNLNILTAI